MHGFTKLNNNFIFTSSDLTNTEYRVYTILKSFCYNNKTTCYPSQRRLAVMMGKSIRTVQRAIAGLKEKGYISIKRNASIIKTSIYTLLRKVRDMTFEKAWNINIGEKDKKTTYDTKSSKTSIKNQFRQYNNKKKDSFGDFPQRNYNFEKLEELILNGIGDLSDCLT